MAPGDAPRVAVSPGLGALSASITARRECNVPIWRTVDRQVPRIDLSLNDST